ncbi:MULTISPECIES: branched-chain amino acid ABC transporter permease [Burkholderia]|jgi:branched-subunit amino acid ABC-type transport system permease component|uniref:Branched-chain amino acid ABC transporter permease n=1 Tax=Burkholderia gladioli TaxID=28095 RepID=A0A095WD94_BURGA|nr:MULTISPECIES: branched-chain amino acid ABC transporter permease [Burkholderia]AJW94082.1 branched-chain amino acid transport system / permease component family protein [Burkholderia gladioli]ASD81948.1 branched-chain amino acid ABC transporter permease [Burkholderia gladioli pv. gladioli]AWY52201.1 branched-chain amino acid ABC transporter permease [Burkholderia gladioli pv. gladioli]KAF1060670.1 High-affinity branched-chain amino acid transport system permease protein LivH [Burkholderia gl
MVLALDVLTTAALLFIVTAGLMVIFGVMKIVNFAHGALLTMGAYASFIVTQLKLDPWFGVPLSLAVGVAVGMLVEAAIVRPLYKRPLDAILATWGLGIVIGQLIVMGFGREVQFVEAPVNGALSVAGTAYSAYRLLLVPIAIVLCAALSALLNGTRFGVKTRAVIMNEDLARGLGIHSGRIRFITFSLGAALGSLAGMLITPLSSVDPNMGLPYLVNAFMLVMVSGYSMLGLLLTCLVFGACQVLVSTFVSPVLGGLTIAVLAALTLRVFPKGLSHA